MGLLLYTAHHGKLFTRYAGVMELVDMQDLGSCVARRVGSSPFTRTKYHEGLARGGLCL